MTRQYRAAAGRARNAAEKTVGFWTRGARATADLVPGVPRVDLVPAVERYFDLVQRTVDINRRLTVRWAQAVGALSGVVREKAQSTGDLVREKAEAADNVMREQAEQAQQAVLEQAEQAEKGLAQAAREQAEKAKQAAREQAQKAEQAKQAAAREQAQKAEQAKQELARQARQAEREQARRAHKRARERYEGLTKAELSDQLAKRELPKTGNVDALIERLVTADSK
jgi:Mg-chelatase subunit ChlI